MRYARAVCDITREMLRGNNQPDTNPTFEKGDVFEFFACTGWQNFLVYDDFVYDALWAVEITEEEFCKAIDSKYLDNNFTEPIPEETWKKGYTEKGLLFVNYQYHEDVCAVSLKRYEKLEKIKALVDGLNEIITEV